MRLVAFALLALSSFALSSVAAEPLAIGSRLELFVDDFLIEQLTGAATQQVVRPEPKEVVLTTDAAWEGNTCAYYTIFRDGDLYRMYYRGSHYLEEKREKAHREVTCYAESKDGIHWTKPKLGLHEFDGSKENNIVLDGLGTHCFAAFKDENPACKPEARYKGISRGKGGLVVFQSPDAIRWELMHPKAVITEGAFDSQNLAFWDPHARLYREYHRIFVGGVRAIMTGTSSDFINWTKPELLEYPNTPAEHLYTNAVMPYPRAPQLLIGFPTRYLPKEGQRVEPTFMASRDGVTFKRWLDPVIPESAPEARSGNRSNYMAWGLVELPDRPEHWSVYGTESYYTGPDSRLRRFEYRKDRFVKVQSKEEGELLTRPLVIGDKTSKLQLNFQTPSVGSIRVAIETADGKPIAGHGLADCAALAGDTLAAAVKWQDSSSLEKLRGKTVRLRFQLKQAELYAMQLIDE